MSNRNTIKDELNDLNSGLNADPGNTPYSVPEGYFDGLADSILFRINSEKPMSAKDELALISPLLAGIPRTLPYSVPEGFFQSNIEGLSAFTSEEESLVLSFIDKEMPYAVPKGYFAGVPDKVMERIGESAKVVPLTKRSWMRIAAAAVVTGLIALSGIIYLQGRGSGDDATGAATTAISVDLKKVSTEELTEFINTTAADVNDGTGQVIANNSVPKKETVKLFQDVSDKELEAFLNQMPTVEDELEIN